MALTVLDGKPLYVRDGKRYSADPLGNGLEAAVAGNAEAQAHARAYSTGMILGLTSFTVGAIVLSADVLRGAVVISEHPPGSWPRPVDGIVLSLGAVAFIVGSVFMINAVPHFYDAINIYNDGVDATLTRRAEAERARPPPPPSVPPPSSPPPEAAPPAPTP